MVKKIFKIVRLTLALLFASSLLAVVAYRFVPVYFTPLMLTRCFEQIADGRSVRLHHEWVPLERMARSMPVAVIASEDQRFMEHHGFDYKAIEQAALEHLDDGKRLRGGSTISQQTAKNVFLWQGRSWLRKGLEAYFTFLIETLWGKQRIMEVYLNSIEMVNDGLQNKLLHMPQEARGRLQEAVAEQHFGINAYNLTRADCALIAATLPNPRRYSSKTPSPYMRKRQRQIMHQMTFISAFDMRR